MSYLFIVPQCLHVIPEVINAFKIRTIIIRRQELAQELSRTSGGVRQKVRKKIEDPSLQQTARQIGELEELVNGILLKERVAGGDSVTDQNQEVATGRGLERSVYRPIVSKYCG